MKYNKSYLARRLALSLIIGGMFVSSAYALPQGGAAVMLWISSVQAVIT